MGNQEHPSLRDGPITCTLDSICEREYLSADAVEQCDGGFPNRRPLEHVSGDLSGIDWTEGRIFLGLMGLDCAGFCAHPTDRWAHL